MQATINGTIDTISEILRKMAAIGKCTIYEKDSDPGKELSIFNDIEDVIKTLKEKSSKRRFWGVAFYYPSEKGYVDLCRISLDPKYCNGFDFRYDIRGWGLIYVQFDFKPKKHELPECFVSCNTEKRANAWAQQYPDLKEPSLWDWSCVNSICRKVRKIFKDCE